MTELKFKITTSQFRQLKQVAAKNLRQPHDQARFIILSALGLVIDDGPILKNSKSASVEVGRTQTSAFAEINS